MTTAKYQFMLRGVIKDANHQRARMRIKKSLEKSKIAIADWKIIIAQIDEETTDNCY